MEAGKEVKLPRSCMALCLCSGSLWAFPGLRYLDDIGDLGLENGGRNSVQLAQAQAIWADGRIRLRGRDDDGKPWEAAVQVAQGLGFTSVWQADFDRNSRADLLIAAYFPLSGRCVDRVTLSFLLFDDRGRPVPWIVDTRSSSFKKPAIFADLNHNGRTEIVVTDCAYSEPPRLGEDRSITGIYEAKDGTWNLIEPAHLAPYVALVRQSHRLRPRADVLLPAIPADWQNQGNGITGSEPSPVRLIGINAALERCRGIHFTILDGQLRNDPGECEELGRDRFQLSDGRTCYGWPTVMVDRPEKREIVGSSEHADAILQEFLQEQREVVMVGQRLADRCSPVLVRDAKSAR